MGGDHHHHRFGIALQYLGQPLEAFGRIGRAAAEIGIEEDDVRAAALHRRERFVRRLEGGDLGEQVPKEQPRGEQDVGIVIDDDTQIVRLLALHRTTPQTCLMLCAGTINFCASARTFRVRN
jgi:hypothetical protein